MLKCDAYMNTMTKNVCLQLAVTAGFVKQTYTNRNVLLDNNKSL